LFGEDRHDLSVSPAHEVCGSLKKLFDRVAQRVADRSQYL